ncbi:H-NS family nucleoid-associated regulatory protein [Acidovorax sp.]|uniref:H-NS histone family protein n=1 Tax=Acidovorax sp. TaxID=1872122 RepID=UPI00391F1917
MSGKESYAELKARQEELERQKEEVDRQLEEARKVVSAEISEQIRKQIKDFGIRPEDLFPELKRSLAKPATARKASSVKYRGPDGETWGGGPGRKPNWVNALIASGKDIEQFRVE